MRIHTVLLNTAFMHEASFQRAAPFHLHLPFWARSGGFLCEVAANGSICFQCGFAHILKPFFFLLAHQSKTLQGRNKEVRKLGTIVAPTLSSS